MDFELEYQETIKENKETRSTVSTKYLARICNHYGLKPKENSRRLRTILAHNFGVDQAYLEGKNSLKKLKQTIDKYRQFPSPADEETGSELISMLNLA